MCYRLLWYPGQEKVLLKTLNFYPVCKSEIFLSKTLYLVKPEGNCMQKSYDFRWHIVICTLHASMTLCK